MTSTPIISWFDRLKQLDRHPFLTRRSVAYPSLRHWAEHRSRLPRFVQQSPTAMRYLRLLGPLAWDELPVHDRRPNGNANPISRAAFAAACLVKLDQQIVSMRTLRQYLVEHPALVWLFGFPLVPSAHFPWGFDADASLPTHRHFTRLLRHTPNAVLQLLLDSSVALLQAEFKALGVTLGKCIAMDTKHILAWVKENNPKAYIQGKRYDKSQQPKGDPDCRLGCKRRRNQRASSKEPPPTPPDNPVPADTVSVGEYYWGYASGIVATKVPDWGEFVLAESTQPFDQSDVSYFFPLMADVERRLGFRPKFAAFDAAFDAFYVYEYFHHQDGEGFAAVPFSQRGGHKLTFDPQGTPLCNAGLPMPLKYVFWSKKTNLVEHERGRHVCPLLYPQPTGDSCPINHKLWSKQGCTTTIPTSIGTRIRYQLDRQSAAYKKVYKQRTASERINSQAKDLGIERPRLRSRPAIVNQNTLIYVLINLRGLHRVRQRKAEFRISHEDTALAA